MISLFPCQNTENDARQAFEWRNDPETIAASYYPRPKSWDSFWLEYAEYYFRTPEIHPYFILKQGLPVGFIRFEPSPLPDYRGKTGLEIMVNIAPMHRRQGVASYAIPAIKKEMKVKNVFALIADIRKKNTPSIRLFKKCGFEFLSERNEYIEKINENCSILCYRCIL